MTPAKRLRRSVRLNDGNVANHPCAAESVPKFEKQANGGIQQGEWDLSENFYDCVNALRKGGAIQ